MATERGTADTPTIPAIKLSNGENIPVVGLGTWKAKAGVAGESVEIALRAGYRHIDCAKAYGNEAEVGNALTKVFKEGKIKRSDVWITSKLWNEDHAAEAVAKACRKTLADLQLEYLDEYIVHWPIAANEGPVVDPPIKETWEAMEKLHDEKLVKSIGVSNFSVKKLEELLMYARIPPAVNQVEVHPFWRNQKLIDFCKSKNIHITAYSPLGSPDSASMMGREENAPNVLDNETVKEIAEKLGKHPVQILIRWAIQHGTSVIPKATGESHIRSNLDVLDWELSYEDFKALSELTPQLRMVDGAMFLKPKGPYKTVREIWDNDVSEDQPNVDKVAE